ncbi:MAG: hypothetical protein IT537_28695 [Hyphomicrobiales bacterium]|nr:hypothetical protein [Hyphomicrobiales bacterium]
MEEGPEGDARTRELIKRATSITAMSTASATEEALDALALRKLILLTPYDQATNDHEIDYLRRIGRTVVHDVALALPGSDDYLAQTPERWVELAVAHARADTDGYFLSCTNTTQIEAFAPIERRLGQPVVNSNQAVLWAATQRLRGKLGAARLAPGLGRLVEHGRRPAAAHRPCAPAIDQWLLRPGRTGALAPSKHRRGATPHM